VKIIKKLEKRGADCVVLSCTEFPLLLSQKDVSVPLVSSTDLHAQEAFEMATGE